MTGQLPVLGTVELFLVNPGIGHHGGWIEHAEPDAGREEAHESLVDSAFGQKSLLYGLYVRPVVVVVIHLTPEINALVVHPPFQRDSRRLRLSRAITVSVENV